MIKLCNFLFSHYGDELSYCERIKYKLKNHKKLSEKEISLLIFIINCRTDDITKEVESWNAMSH